MNILIRQILSLAGIVGLLMSCASPPHYRIEEYEGWHVYEGYTFSLCIPPQYRVQQHEPGVDFLLYSVIETTGKHAVLLGIYEGNHPDFGGALPHTAPFHPTQTTLGAWTMYRVQWRDRHQHYYGEVAIERSIAFPNFLHFWFTEVSKEERHVIERIIHSLTVEKTACSTPQ
jgi:hypothetical protein